MSVALPNLTLPVALPPTEQLLSLRRHWRLILTCTVGIPVWAAIVLVMLPASYNATGIVLYDPAGAALPGSAAATAQNSMDEDAITASQGAIIASLPTAAAIAQQLGLMKDPVFNAALRRRHFPFTLLPRAAPSSSADLAGEVQNRLGVSVLPGSRVLSVSFTAQSPQLAAGAVNLAMQLYLKHERETSFQALTDAQDWLETHSAIVQQQLDDTETALAKARAGAGMVQGEQATLTTETANRLTAGGQHAERRQAVAHDAIGKLRLPGQMVCQTRLALNAEYGVEAGLA